MFRESIWIREGEGVKGEKLTATLERKAKKCYGWVIKGITFKYGFTHNDKRHYQGFFTVLDGESV